MRQYLLLGLLICLSPAMAHADAIVNGVVFGDSFSNDANDWTGYTDSSFDTFAFGGRSLANIANNFEDELSTVDASSYDGILLMAGINDIYGDRSLETIQDIVASILELVPADKTLVLTTLPPALGHQHWNDSRQEVADSYNEWIRSLPMPVFDLNAVLDANSDNRLDAAWDAGDHLHPSTGANGGAGHIALNFDSFNSVPEPSCATILLCFGLVAARSRRKTS